MREHLRPGDHRPMDHSATATILKTFLGADAHTQMETSKFSLFTKGVPTPTQPHLATPVFRQGGLFVGSLTIPGPITRLTSERTKAIAQPLREAGLRLSRALGADLIRSRAFEAKTASTG
jgi:DNA-binding IclR family transcriptional regulator